MLVFDIKPDENGKLPRKIVPFNYYELLKPKSSQEISALLGGVQKDDDSSANTSSSASSGSSAPREDSVPF